MWATSGAVQRRGAVGISGGLRESTVQEPAARRPEKRMHTAPQPAQAPVATRMRQRQATRAGQWASPLGKRCVDTQQPYWYALLADSIPTALAVALPVALPVILPIAHHVALQLAIFPPVRRLELEHVVMQRLLPTPRPARRGVPARRCEARQSVRPARLTPLLVRFQLVCPLFLARKTQQIMCQKIQTKKLEKKHWQEGSLYELCG